MTDVERLLAAFASGKLLRPASGVLNFVDLARALAFLTGVKGTEQTPSSQKLANLIGPADHLIFMLVDGLGMELLEAMPDGSFLQAHLVTELRTIFPSTTAVALTTLATGEWPNKHAVTGWWTHLPQIAGAATILPFVTRAGGRPLTQLHLTADAVFPVSSLIPRMNRDPLCLLPERIADSVYSQYFSGGTARLGYKTLSHAIQAVLERIETAPAPTYTFLYLPQIDDVVHHYGTTRSEVRIALLEIDRELKRLAAALGSRGRIVVSADHGFLDAPQTARHQLKASHNLAAALRCPPAGDARVLYFHLRHTAIDLFRQEFQKRFGDRFLLISVEEAERLELFGPGPIWPHTKSRLGDYIAISIGADVIEYRPLSGVGRVMSLASHHSGLSPAEMRIPLVLA